MATEIKRVRFFDGQFLKQLEFQEEQAYHMHLRRRMNFFLFGQSGVVPIGADDLQIFDLDPGNKTFRVRAGMAICHRPLLQEGKEIVLFADSPPIDLDNEGIVAGGKAHVTLHWQEEAAKDPPSEGDVDENTRFRETARLSVYNGNGPLPTTAANGEQLILLGTIDYDAMTADHSNRHEARLRASLIPAAMVLAPSITSLTGTTSAALGGPAVTATIHGTHLGGASVVFSDPAVTATILPGGTATTVNISVTVGGTASAGAKSFSVTTPGGTALSPVGVTFTVTGAPAAPVITGISVTSAAQGAVVAASITGTGLLGATSVSFSGTGVAAAINPGGTAITLPVTLTVAATAAIGPRTFDVVTSGGNAGSGAVTLTVTASAPPVSILNLQPPLQGTGGTIEIHGNNIRNAVLAPFAPAAGTVVQLSKGIHNVAATNPIALADIAGHQVVRVTIPPRTGTPWATTESVTLTLSFNGSSANLLFTYDD